MKSKDVIYICHHHASSLNSANGRLVFGYQEQEIRNARRCPNLLAELTAVCFDVNIASKRNKGTNTTKFKNYIILLY